MTWSPTTSHPKNAFGPHGLAVPAGGPPRGSPPGAYGSGLRERLSQGMAGLTRSAPPRNASPSGAPRITAVVPTFNGGRLLERCLDATLDAAEVDEVIVLDGGSTDGSPERAERRDRIRVLRRPDLCVM